MKRGFLCAIVLIVFIASSCTKEPAGLDQGIIGPHNGHLKVAVVSDIHYMDPSLLQNGAANGGAFQEYLATHRKLIDLSPAIFTQAIEEIKAEKPDILLIPGDLTKDGEKISHIAVANFLRQLANEQIKIYVVPGNHDINNPEAVTYNGNTASPIPSISAAEFSSIYFDYGYGNAIARDPNSLSYVCEPQPGLWILGIDDCKYQENKNFAIVGGKIKPATMTWIQAQLTEAKMKNITVLGMMHHNLIEHYTGESQFDFGFVTDDWEATSNTLISAGLNIIFTGHYHANDVTKRVNSDKELYDIETGSLVTAPLPYRIIDIHDRDIDIVTKNVTTIASGLPVGFSLPTYANFFLAGHLDAIFGNVLTQPPFLLDGSHASSSAPLYRNALMAHYAGDEKISMEEQAKDNALAPISPVAAYAVSTLWSDLAPADNNVHIKMSLP